MRSSATAASTRSSRPRSSSAARSSARSPSTPTGATRFDDAGRGRPRRPRRPGVGRPSPTSSSSTSSSARARRTPSGPTPSGPCARSPPASRPSSTRPTSWTASSPRRPACSARTAPGSTCGTSDLGALRWAYAAGEAMADVPDWGRTGGLKPRQAVAGLAFAEQRPGHDRGLPRRRAVRDDPRDRGVRPRGRHPRRHLGAADRRRRGPLGVLSVVSREPGAYTDDRRRDARGAGDPRLDRDHATPTSWRSWPARARTSSAAPRPKPALREIAARITALREPDEVLQRVVDEARRLLRADGAVIDQYDPESGTLQWAYDAGIPDDAARGASR